MQGASGTAESAGLGPAAACELLEPLARQQPPWAAAHYIDTPRTIGIRFGQRF